MSADEMNRRIRAAVTAGRRVLEPAAGERGGPAAPAGGGADAGAGTAREPGRIGLGDDDLNSRMRRAWRRARGAPDGEVV